MIFLYMILGLQLMWILEPFSLNTSAPSRFVSNNCAINSNCNSKLKFVNFSSYDKLLSLKNISVLCLVCCYISCAILCNVICSDIANVCSSNILECLKCLIIVAEVSRVSTIPHSSICASFCAE
jgi:hypothetical protein